MAPARAWILFQKASSTVPARTEAVAAASTASLDRDLHVGYRYLLPKCLKTLTQV
jgi:hypothetical protein